MLCQLSYSRTATCAVNQRNAGEQLVGIEPTTARLRIECSTPELQWRPALPVRAWRQEAARLSRAGETHGCRRRVELSGIEPLTS